MQEQNNNVNREEMTMAELLDQSFDLQPVERNTIIKGTIVSKSSSELLVDIGSKYEGIVRAKDLDRVSPEMVASLSEGDEIFVYVMHLEDEEGYVELSLSRAQIEQDWERAKEAFDAAEVFEGDVVNTNKGGLIVNFGAVRGFVPGSQLASEHTTRSAKANQWANMVGKTLSLKIIEVDRRRNRLILSEREAVQEQRQAQKEQLLKELQEGDVREGRVTSLADFGAFVDLGGAEGLVHLSELAWVQVSHPREILKVGDEIKVHVLSIDRDRQRIGLSLKQLQPEPWSQVIDKYQVDQIVPAVITKLTSFGAFARVDDFIEGLIHISELSSRPISHPREVVNEGDEVEVNIISIDPDRKRMGLSLKNLMEPEIEWVDEDDDDDDDDDDTQASSEETEETSSADTEETTLDTSDSDQEEEQESQAAVA